MTITAITPDTRARADRVARGLIALHAFLECHPDLPLGPVEPLCYPATGGTDQENRAEVDRIARMLGVAAGPAYGHEGYYQARRDFGGGITYQATAVTAAELERRARAAGRAAA